MKYLSIALVLIPLVVFAVPEIRVYPNSGASDAKVDQNTNIPEFSANPIDQGSSIQRQEGQPNDDKGKFEVGPYDSSGNYMPPYKKPGNAATD